MQRLSPSVLSSLLLALSLAVGVPSAAAAQQDQPSQPEALEAPTSQPAEASGEASDDASEEQPAATQPAYKDLKVTEHEINVAGGIRFQATVGTLDMKNDAGQTRGTMFFTYYERLGEDGEPLHAGRDNPRPITYVFNGGPGAASVWLHLGTAGPYRVPMGEQGEFPAPPYVVEPNESTWLDVTDLVFIDPVGTGFSRPVDEKAGKEFYGVLEDRQWVGEFIRLHATRFGRWDDAKFLAGESYGTTRAAQLSDYLHSRYGLDVNGVILISTVLDFATIREAENNLLPYVLFMPSYAQIALHHGKIDGEMEEIRQEAEEFAIEEYLPALAMGNLLDEKEKASIARKYSKLTGLPVDYVLASDLRVGPHRFMKALLNEERQLVGRMDGRITGYDTDPINDTPNNDPSLGGYVGVYTGAFTGYVRDRLGFESDLAYEVLSGRVNPWQGTRESTGSYSGGYLNVADDLQSAMIAVPEMKLFVAGGFYDLATPYFAADYTVGQMNLPPEVRENVTQKYYGGGHMMYHVAAERRQLKEDVAAFIEEATPGE